MLRKITLLCFLFSFFPLLIVGQNKALLRPNGKLELKAGNDVISAKYLATSKIHKVNSLSKPNATADTLTYNNGRTNGFILDAQDILVQWFEAPADMNIISVGIVFNDNANSNPASVKLVKTNWTKAQIMGAGVKWYGYYPAAGNGYNNITGFLDNGDRTGDWVAASTAPITDPIFAEDIWSDGGLGKPITPTTMDEYLWINMDDLGIRPEIKAGEIFGVVLKNDYPTLGVNTDDQIVAYGDNTLGIPGFKYYCGGRLVTDPTDANFDAGWWSREYTWDFIVAVELTGDTPPTIEDVTTLTTTLKTTARTVSATITDDNPSGGAAGVASATLKYSVDGGTTYSDIAMTAAGDVYSADIPGQSAGTTVYYYIYATDVAGNASETVAKSYSVFQKTQDLLFIYNTNDLTKASASKYYLKYGPEKIDHDFWSIRNDRTGELDDLLALYDWVVEVGGSYPSGNITSNIKTWLDATPAAGKRGYFLSSQDYGCWVQSKCADTSFVPGTFQYDYLGLAGFAGQDFPGGGTVPMQVVPAQGDPVSGWVAQTNADSNVTYWFDPNYEIGTTFDNYADNLVVATGGNATTIFTANYESAEKVVGIRNRGANWYTSFISFDYLASNFRSDTSLSQDSDPKYMWGVTVKNQVAQFLTWAGFTTDVAPQDGVVPKSFSLKQNYPNPFNPATSISFSVAERSNVKIKIYDMLGSEVAVLVNEVKNPGNYTVSFDASNLSSGLYVYSLTAGNFTATKKMMLLK